MNSRILHAAARGARIQTRYTDTFTSFGEWKTVSGMVFNPEQVAYPHEQRIHPDDEHLQYGPISTNLREAAESEPEWLQDSLNEYACAAATDYTDGELGYLWGIAQRLPLLDKQLFLLILAEAIADQGM